MQEARSSMAWLGVDTGEQEHQALLLDGRGEVERQWRWKNQAQELEDQLRKLAAQVEAAGRRLRLVTEAGRGVGAVLCRVALSLGIELWQVSPPALKDFRRSEGQPRKTDAWDAFLLARMGFLGLQSCRLMADAQPEERRLCRMSRLSEQLAQQRSQALQRLRCRLLELVPALATGQEDLPRLRSVRLRALLRRYPGLEGVEEASVHELEEPLSTVGRQQRRREAQALRRVCAEIRMDPREREVLTFELQLLVEELERIEQARQRLDQSMDQQVRAHPVGEKLLEMPGVGTRVAAVLVGEVLPLARHVSEAKVATYCGVTPLCRRSGKSDGRDRLARGTNKHVLRALYLSATASRRVSALDRRYYDQQHQRHQGHPATHVVATLALARQRIKVMYKLMTTPARYDKEILIRSHLDRHRRAA